MTQEYLSNISWNIFIAEKNCNNNELLAILYDLLSSERRYNGKLHLALHLLDRLQCGGYRFEAKLIRDALRPICLTSSTLIGNLNCLLDRKHCSILANQSGQTDCFEIVGLFAHSFWIDYNDYHHILAGHIRKLLRVRRRQDRNLASFLHQLECQFGANFDVLLLLPEDRLLFYHSALSKFSKSSSPHDTTRWQLNRTLEHLADSGALKERHREIASVQNEQRLETIESRFHKPVDLVEARDLNMRFLGQVRETNNVSLPAIGSRHVPLSSRRTTSQNQTEMPAVKSDCSIIDVRNNEEESTRTYLKEGRVLISSALQTQERYLFLFNDLLLIAKEKGANSYKLKNKIRLCQVWLRAEGVEEVAESVQNSSHSFVIGWPTNNFVAEFESLSERDVWFSLLEQTIGKEKDRESPKITTVRIYCKSVIGGHKNTETRRITVNNLQTTNDVMKLSMAEFDLSSDTPLRLWVHSSRDREPYPLFGHESPFAIVMTHVRDLLQDNGVEFTGRQLEDVSSLNSLHDRCRLVLRPRAMVKAPAIRSSRMRRPGALVNQLRRALSKTDETRGRREQTDERLNQGRLFGRPLHQLTDDNSVPIPLLNMLDHIYREGGSTEGIFRRSSKHSTVKALKLRLDMGESVVFEGEHYSLVTACLLKDFLRNIPHSLLVSDLYCQWVSDVCDEQNPNRKLVNCRRLLSQLPPANYQLLRHLLCVLRRVSDLESTSKMSPSNLSVCIGPSLLERQNSLMDVHDSLRRIPQLAQFLIEQYDSGDGQVGPEFSSADSLPICTSPDPFLKSSSLIRRPGNESRDSGLSTDDGFHTNSQSSNRHPGSSPNPVRSFSEIDDLEPGFVIASTKSAVDLNTDQVLVDNIDRNRVISNVDGREVSSFMTCSWHPTLIDYAKEKDGEDNDANIVSIRTKIAKNTLKMSLDSTLFNSAPSKALKRLSIGTLKRSESGEHLLLNEGDVTDGNNAARLSVSSSSTGSHDESDGRTPDRLPNLQRHDLGRRPVHHRPTVTLSAQSSLSTEEESEMVVKPLVIRCNTQDTFPPSAPPLPSIPPPNTDVDLSSPSEPSTSGISSLSSLNDGAFGSGNSSPLPMIPIAANVTRDKQLSHDSSTVTEDSSDEEKTPVVSRENSRAQDLRPNVRRRFQGQPPLLMTKSFSSVGRPLYSWESADQKAKTPISPSHYYYRNTQIKTTKPKPPTYEETMRRCSLRGEETAAEIIAARQRISSVLSRRTDPLEPRITTANLMKKLPVAEVQGRPQSRPRRKTLAGIEFNQSNIGPIEPTIRMHTGGEPRPLEINWSVNRLRSMFDNGGRTSPRSNSNNNNNNNSKCVLRMPKVRMPAVQSSVNSPSTVPPTIPTVLPKSSLTSTRSKSTHCNYPILYPPPLLTTSSGRMPLRIANSQPQPSGMVRSLASTFEFNVIAQRKPIGGEISYV